MLQSLVRINNYGGNSEERKKKYNGITTIYWNQIELISSKWCIQKRIERKKDGIKGEKYTERAHKFHSDKSKLKRIDGIIVNGSEHIQQRRRQQ